MPAILVVDDRPEAVQLLRDLLELEGYETAAAFDGQQALDSVRHQLPDLVLLDINMPNLNGYEVCQRLKADPKTADVPVLMLTAWAEPDHRVKGLQMGAVDYLAKPFDHRELLARIETQLRAKCQADGLRATQQTIRETFERFVPAHVVERLLADPNQVSLGGSLQLVTILFADLRGYTAMAETLDPKELVDVLNGHLNVAAQAVLAYDGTISHYSGDLVMAIFNAPLPQPDHAVRAAKAALLLRREMANYHLGLPPELRMDFGVGIASGEAVVGNIGTKELFNFTAVGDTVNLAQRLEGIAEGGQVLLTDCTQQHLQGAGFQTEIKGLTALRGRSEPVTVHALLGLDNEGNE
jgi:class 3 adenylate cyclase